MSRRTVSSGTEWEAHVGYSGAVAVNGHVHVSGTTPAGEDGEVFEDVRPAATMVEVSRLVDEDFCVEIEVTAVAQG